MSKQNAAFFVGNLVDDPELRFTASGLSLANIRLAVNRRWTDRNNQQQEATDYLNGTLWGQHAENAAESLKKGIRIIITGEMRQRQWETKTGERRSAVEIHIDEIGPALRWATAQVSHVEKYANEKGTGSAAKPAAYSRPDEEPF